MATVSIYLNFMGNTEVAFEFYKSVFGTEYSHPIDRMGDAPADDEMGTGLSEEDKNKVMNVQLPILGGVQLMGTDMLESMGHELVQGNNISINLQTDNKEQAEELFNKLSAGGKIEAPLKLEFWGDWFASFEDKFGVRWMIIAPDQAAS